MTSVVFFSGGPLHGSYRALQGPPPLEYRVPVAPDLLAMIEGEEPTEAVEIREESYRLARSAGGEHIYVARSCFHVRSSGGRWDTYWPGPEPDPDHDHRATSPSDSAPGMTLAELLGDIDDVLGEEGT